MIKKNSLLFVCLLCAGYMQGQELGIGIRASVFRPIWNLPLVTNINPPATLTNTGYTIFDYNIGMNLDYAHKKYIFSLNSMYEFNSMRSTAHNFPRNSEINRFYNMYFWHNQLRVMRTITIHKRKFQAGVGLDLDIWTRKKKTIGFNRLNYIPIQGFDPQDQGKESFSLLIATGARENLVPGVHFEARTDIGELAGKRMFLFINTSMTLKTMLEYEWYFNGKVFAQYQGYRLTPRIGFQWMIANDIKLKSKNKSIH